MNTGRTLRTSVLIFVLVLTVGVLATGGVVAQQTETVEECRVLNQTDTTYVVNDDIRNGTVDACLEIRADGVTLDGDGHRVNGVNRRLGSVGVFVNDSADVTVKNFGNVTGWETGIGSEASSNTVISDNTANRNVNGIALFTVGAVVRDNTANRNDDYGIWLTGFFDNEVVGNLVERNRRAGIYLDVVDDHLLEDNTARENDYGFWVRDSEGNEFSNNVAENNFIGIYTRNSFSNTFEDDTSRDNFEYDFADRTIPEEETEAVSDLNTVENLNIGNSEKSQTEVSFETVNFVLRGTSIQPPANPDAEATGRYFETAPLFLSDGSIDSRSVVEENVEPQQIPPAILDIDLHYDNADVEGINENSLSLWGYDTGEEWMEFGDEPGTPDSEVDKQKNVVSWNFTLDVGYLSRTRLSPQGEGEVSPTQTPLILLGAFGDEACVNRRNLGRGQDESECPFDRDVQRGGSREGLDERTERGGRGNHRDSATQRRNRGR